MCLFGVLRLLNHIENLCTNTLFDIEGSDLAFNGLDFSHGGGLCLLPVGLAGSVSVFYSRDIAALCLSQCLIGSLNLSQFLRSVCILCMQRTQLFLLSNLR